MCRYFVGNQILHLTTGKMEGGPPFNKLQFLKSKSQQSANSTSPTNIKTLQYSQIEQYTFKKILFMTIFIYFKYFFLTITQPILTYTPARPTLGIFWQICGKTVPAWRLKQQEVSEGLSKITKTELTTAESFRDRFVPFYPE